MEQIAIIGYGERYEEFCRQIGDGADEILKGQMDRVAKIMGYTESWFA